jgi:hypothetical protein
MVLKSKLFCDRQSASLSSCRTPIRGPQPDFYYSRTFEGFFCCCGAHTLIRGRVWDLLPQLLPGLACAVTHGPKSRRIRGRILLPHLRLPQPGWTGFRIYIQKHCGLVTPTCAGFPFCRFLLLARLR